MFLKLHSVSIYYELVGESGPFVTLVNGHTRSSTDFRMFSRFLVDRKYRVLIFDNRGAGRTESEGQIKMHDFVSDVVSLWEHLGIERSHVLGISMGAMIAMNLALQYGQKIASLCLISTTPSEKWMLPRGGEWKDDEEVVRHKLGRFFSEGYLERNPLVFDAMVKQILNAIRKDRYVEKGRDQKNAFNGIDLTGELHNIMPPSLIIHGTEDRAVSVEAARELHRLIPDSRLKLIEGAGHLLLAESPKEVYESYADFLGNL